MEGADREREEWLAAAQWIADSDALILAGGAGMSAQEGNNVYVSKQDFARHYPYMRGKRSTAYECIDLYRDPTVSSEEKWGFWSKHMTLQRWQFPPTEAYAMARELLSFGEEDGHEKEHFVLTSNVDGCFERSGFSNIYTPQGDWSHYQCMGRDWSGPCRSDAVWPSKEHVDRAFASLDESTGCVGSDRIPRCRLCGGETFGNVRGGNWFLHRPYDAQHDRFISWARELMAAGKRVTVVEIGCGFNTPTIVRFPMEALVDGLQKSSSDRARQSAFIRFNPQHSDVGITTTRSAGFQRGWDGLRNLLDAFENSTEAERREADAAVCHRRDVLCQLRRSQASYEPMSERARKVFGHWDWEQFLTPLKGK